MIQVIALDFDGVIVDSLPIRDEGFKQAFSQYGECVANQVREFHINHRGLFRRNKLKRIYKEVLNLEPTKFEIDEAEERFIELTLKELINAELLPGVTKLWSLPDNITLYIVSAAPQEEVHFLAKQKGIDALFEEVLGGPKNKIIHLNNIVNKQECLPEQVLFVGDALKDYEASLDVGCLFLGIVPQDLLSPFPEYVTVFYNLLSCLKFVENEHI